MKLEIERKFLLKAMPSKSPDDTFVIDQYYFKNKEGVWERARTYHSDKSGDTYIHTIKTSVSKSVNIEDEKEITKKEYEDFKSKCQSGKYESRYIQKTRHVYKDGDLKWEVDKFGSGYTLIIAEIEIPKKNFKITFPEYISDVLLLEVTGIKQFSNRSLSIKI